MIKYETVFIAGTDTGVGKTVFSLALINALQAKGLLVNGMKPLASGCEITQAGLRNDDALKLQAASTNVHEYNSINPYAFAAAVSPHIAAGEEGVNVSLDVIVSAYENLKRNSGLLVVEGVGGWRTPWSDSLSSRDLVRRLEMPVVLVVGMKLGCINHALLTAEAMQKDGVNLIAWVANEAGGFYQSKRETIHTINQVLGVPLISDMAYNPEPVSQDYEVDLSQFVSVQEEHC